MLTHYSSAVTHLSEPKCPSPSKHLNNLYLFWASSLDCTLWIPFSNWMTTHSRDRYCPDDCRMLNVPFYLKEYELCSFLNFAVPNFHSFSTLALTHTWYFVPTSPLMLPWDLVTVMLLTSVSLVRAVALNATSHGIPLQPAKNKF